MQDPYLKKFEDSKKFFEVYPHPSMVVLFGLNKILKYKSKPNRDYAFRWKEFKKYQYHLKKLKPALILPKEISNKKMSTLKGNSLKDYEDLLDAVFCAYISYYYWKYPDKCAILGNMKERYILTPIFSHMRSKVYK